MKLHFWRGNAAKFQGLIHHGVQLEENIVHSISIYGLDDIVSSLKSAKKMSDSITLYQERVRTFEFLNNNFDASKLSL